VAVVNRKATMGHLIVPTTRAAFAALAFQHSLVPIEADSEQATQMAILVLARIRELICSVALADLFAILRAISAHVTCPTRLADGAVSLPGLGSVFYS
jgi:hypothetical protein